MAGLVGGILIAAFAIPLVGLLAGTLGVSLDDYVIALLVAMLSASTLAAATAGRPARVWRFTLVVAGSCALLLATVHLAGGGLSPAAEAGSDLAPAALIAFFTGVVLLLVGLLIGREDGR